MAMRVWLDEYRHVFRITPALHTQQSKVKYDVTKSIIIKINKHTNLGLANTKKTRV
jgi:hypothetical protein